ncbi:MAG: coenzyme F420-0:L-glutamate ligase, partial [Actinomycetota bacterium]|nr:coenzyme F420-0:L-glutamate ligase [Actinomycetota bacterium]
MSELRVVPVEGLPEVTEGAKLGELIAARIELHPGDIVVISQKIVSKAEGRVRRLSEVEPSERARQLAAEHDKDPALVELILNESRQLLRAERGILITETHHGLVCANAGIDSSNLPEPDAVLLLPDAAPEDVVLTPGVDADHRPHAVVVRHDGHHRAPDDVEDRQVRRVVELLHLGAGGLPQPLQHGARLGHGAGDHL